MDSLQLSKDKPIYTSLFLSAKRFESASSFYIIETNFQDDRKYPQKTFN